MAEINANIVVEPINLSVVQTTTDLGVTVEPTSLNLYTTVALAGGSPTELLYNNNGQISGVPITTFDGGNITLGDVANVKIGGGTNTYFLQTDGAGTIGWAPGTVSANTGNGIANGAVNQIQMTDGTGNFISGAGFTFDNTSNVLNVPGNINGQVATLNSVTLTEDPVEFGNLAVASDQAVAIGKRAISNATTAGLGTAHGISIGVDSYAATDAVSIGYFAGNTFFSRAANAHLSVAIGQSAGSGNNRGVSSVAVGQDAGHDQGNYAVGVGAQAGYSLNIGGDNAIAIGYKAGVNNTHANSIIFNATGANLDSATANSLYIKPIRSAGSANVLTYDTTTGEVTQTDRLEYLTEAKANLFSPIANGSANLGLTGARFANAFINDLNITDSISANITPTTASSTTISHKIPITIDGTTYYICLDSAP